jgi:stearoyl-CoA desaturase (delta-9 desaturase)
VWQLNEPPGDLVRNEKKLGRGTVEKVARHLVANLSVESIVEQVRESWERTPTLEQLRARAGGARASAAALLAGVHVPHVPTTDELRTLAREMYAATPSLDDIATRARELILESIAAELLAAPSPA